MIDFLSNKHKIKRSFMEIVFKRETQFESFGYIALHRRFFKDGKKIMSESETDTKHKALTIR